ncbi:MAG: translation elongation factor Ts [Cytophagales bacterium]|nr:translation elongation factor Ts [Bernardetiaceae bacterium]MDW8210287.1 translation elongation factor Ts [Cytophagales bacterium]
MSVTASDVNKLRQMTGAGVMDCKKALIEANGDFEAAIDILRKKGQKVAASRADRQSCEGTVFLRVSADKKQGFAFSLNCETDFVAKNEEFLSVGNKIADLIALHQPSDVQAIHSLLLEDNRSVADHLTELMGKIGEKIQIANYAHLKGECIVSYLHMGAKVGVLVALNSSSQAAEVAGKDVAMQIAAMRPIAVNRQSVDPAIVARELEIAKEQARAEGKPEAMLEKIAMGKLNKFYKESTLLEQEFVKDNTQTVGQYLESVEKGLTVIDFKRISVAG